MKQGAYLLAVIKLKYTKMSTEDDKIYKDEHFLLNKKHQ